MATVALVNGTLIDGLGRDPVRNAGIVIDDGRIVDGGAGVEPPRGADVIDAGGRTIMPGLIDSHVHLYGRVAGMQERLNMPPSLSLLHATRNAQRTLEAGITSARDCGGLPAGFRMAVERGLVAGPRLKVAVGILSQTGGHGDGTMASGVQTSFGAPVSVERPQTVVDGTDEVRRAVRSLLRAGADFIKLCSTGGVLSPSDEPTHTQFTPDEIAVMVQEAAAAGKTCAAHAQGREGIMNAVRAGVASIEHGIYVDDEIIDEMKKRGTFLVPTLSAPRWVLRFAETAPGTMLPQAVRKTREVLEHHDANIARAIAAGVRVAMGTDSGVGHHGSNTEELRLMVGAGMTPMQAIEASTRVAAECIGTSADVGTLEPGKYGDLLVVDGDPLADISVLEHGAKLAVILQGGMVVKDAR